MDTGTDFIQPEFLNIIFFQQKNVVVFPYVDLKHLHALEIFTVGYNVIDLESTALYNLKEIIEFETGNCYSQSQSLFFIYNLNKEKLRELINISGIRCILNTNDNVSDLISDDFFIFFNKKHKKFLNYHPTDAQLEFERYLINSSENETILYEKIQHIKILATKIFNELNKNPNSGGNIPEILKEYEVKYWNRILDFTSLYFNIEIPNLVLTQKKYHKDTSNPHPTTEENTQIIQFLQEYQFITSLNKFITNEFIQNLHHYRSEKVNPRNLDVEQLYHPQKIYIYLRTHHWSDKIDIEFFKDWIQMRNTRHILTQQDISDFEQICDKLQLPKTILTDNSPPISDSHLRMLSQKNVISKTNHTIQEKLPKKINSELPTVQSFNEFKAFFLKRLEDIEQLISNLKD